MIVPTLSYRTRLARILNAIVFASIITFELPVCVCTLSWANEVHVKHISFVPHTAPHCMRLDKSGLRTATTSLRPLPVGRHHPEPSLAISSRREVCIRFWGVSGGQVRVECEYEDECYDQDHE